MRGNMEGSLEIIFLTSTVLDTDLRLVSNEPWPCFPHERTNLEHVLHSEALFLERLHCEDVLERHLAERIRAFFLCIEKPVGGQTEEAPLEILATPTPATLRKVKGEADDDDDNDKQGRKPRIGMLE